MSAINPSDPAFGGEEALFAYSMEHGSSCCKRRFFPWGATLDGYDNPIVDHQNDCSNHSARQNNGWARGRKKKEKCGIKEFDQTETYVATWLTD